MAQLFLTPTVLYELDLDHFKICWCRNASECNEQHDVEISSARVAAEQDVAKNNEDMLQHVDSKS